ncbi:MAG: lysophospholipid acyltransferase family protein, partial [Rhodospirillales bacterium]|nr:lysophospholipid acyltransferase family protein [Rhodospirillales bacterium]
VEIVGAGIIDVIRDDQKPGLFFSGHMGNWELAALGMTRRGLPVHVAYRAANNPLVNKIFQRQRDASGSEFFAKGADGAKHALKTLGEGGHVAMLVDQKMNDGISVPLLGIDAMTAPAIAHFAIRHQCPVVPTRVERLEGARFRLTFYPPIEAPGTGDRLADTQTFMSTVNDLLGEWIKERPEQWLWVHNRWPPVP